MDRGLFDSLAFLHLLVTEGIVRGQDHGISEQDIAVFMEHSAHWGYLVDLVVILDIAPMEAFSRDLADMMNAPPSRTVSNLNTMRMLREVYKKVIREYSSSFPQVETLACTSDDSALDIALKMRNIIINSPAFEGLARTSE
jgi:hypothetical protein